MSESELCEVLRSLIEGAADVAEGQLEDEHGEQHELRAVRTFDEVGMLTMNKGLVLRFNDGEFQLTVVRSH